MHSKLDGRPDPVEMVEEFFGSALPEDAEKCHQHTSSTACVWSVPSPVPELHVEVSHHSRDQRAYRCTFLLLIEVS